MFVFCLKPNDRLFKLILKRSIKLLQLSLSQKVDHHVWGRNLPTIIDFIDDEEKLNCTKGNWCNHRIIEVITSMMSWFGTRISDYERGSWFISTMSPVHEIEYRFDQMPWPARGHSRSPHIWLISASNVIMFVMKLSFKQLIDCINWSARIGLNCLGRVSLSHKPTRCDKTQWDIVSSVSEQRNG